jgi:hypothetical protein
MKKILMMIIALLELSAVAWAGHVTYPETKVDLTNLQASGSLYGTRYSADSVQQIGCTVGMSWDFQGDYLYATCFAQDKDSNYLRCTSRDKVLVDAILGVTTDSYISFKCKPVSYWHDWTLTNFYVVNGSHLTAPLP